MPSLEYEAFDHGVEGIETVLRGDRLVLRELEQFCHH